MATCERKSVRFAPGDLPPGVVTEITHCDPEAGDVSYAMARANRNSNPRVRHVLEIAMRQLDWRRKRSERKRNTNEKLPWVEDKRQTFEDVRTALIFAGKILLGFSALLFAVFLICRLVLGRPFGGQ